MTARAVRFTGERSVVVDERPVPTPAADELLVAAEVSAVSAGTELTVYRGHADRSLVADETLAAFDGTFSYPMEYGYAVVGRVRAVGADCDPDWEGRRVFAFQPHCSHFTAAPEELVAVPEDFPPERAAFLANAETAVALTMDARPKVGEQAVVYGGGVVGGLTAGVLSGFPLTDLVVVEPDATRRERALRLGATAAVAPDDELAAAMGGEAAPEGADLVVEASGNPAALDAAIDAVGYAGRVVIASWYGTDPTELSLDGTFHRSHVRLRASQVSRIDHEHADRWDKSRRTAVAWRQLDALEPEWLVTHRVPVEDAGETYRMLADGEGDPGQVLFTY
jgi:alcohol dehydrogenase